MTQTLATEWPAVCPGCGNPVTDPGLWLAQPEPDSPALDYCGPACGSTADQRTMTASVRAEVNA